MHNDKSINLGSSLRDRIEVLKLLKGNDGNYTWKKVAQWHASVGLDAGSNIFSKVGIGARGATVALRPAPSLTLHNAFRYRGQFLFLTSIIPSAGRDRLEVKAAICTPVTFTAEPKAKTGRDKMNRPTVEKVAAFTFPGVWTELYRKEQDEGVVDTELVQRVIVTPKEIKLRRGDVVRDPDGTAWPVMRVLELDEYKNEYVVYCQEDP